MKGFKEEVYVILFIYLFTFLFTFILCEECWKDVGLGKVRKGYGVSSQSRCLDSSVGRWQRPLTPDACCCNYSLGWTVTHRR